MSAPIAYMERTRDYYLALGYDNPYRWAHHDDAPFHRLAKPLAQSRIALVTTAAPYQPGKGEQGPGAPYNTAAKFWSVYSGESARDNDLRIAHVAIDRSQQRTLEVDAPQLSRLVREDGADAAILVANCPVCHQSLSLAARRLEAEGVATVVMGCARDIVEWCGVPRFLFSDFPLGNAAGRPRDPESQEFTLREALTLLEQAEQPRVTRRSPLSWSGAPDWKLDYANVARLSPSERVRLMAEAEAARALARAQREKDLGR